MMPDTDEYVPTHAQQTPTTMMNKQAAICELNRHHWIKRLIKPVLLFLLSLLCTRVLI
jgi:hypothetical protein